MLCGTAEPKLRYVYTGSACTRGAAREKATTANKRAGFLDGVCRDRIFNILVRFDSPSAMGLPCPRWMAFFSIPELASTTNESTDRDRWLVLCSHRGHSWNRGSNLFLQRQELHLAELDRVALGLERDAAAAEHFIPVLDQPAASASLSSSWAFSYSRTVSPFTMCLMTPLPWTSASTVTHWSP